MLSDRGCARVRVHVPPVGELGLLAEGDARVRVYLCTEDRVGVKYARAVLDAGAEQAVVVSIDGPTPFTRKECERIQFFTARDLCVNVTKHHLVPKHERVTGPPAGIDAAHLPRLLDTDRVVQYYGWKVGSVVRIHRVFGGHEPITYYRVVVGA